MIGINGYTVYNNANIEGRIFTDTSADVEQIKFDTQAISYNDVTNTTNIASNLAVTGTSTLTDVNITGTLSLPTYNDVAGTLDTITQKITDITYDSGTDTTSVSGKLNVTGNTSVTGTSTLLGNTTIGTLSYGLFFQRNGNQGLAGTTYSAYTQGTLEIWYKNVGTVANTQAIFGVQNSFLIYLSPTNRLATYDYGAGVARNSNTYITDGGWHHLALVFELGVSNGTKLYYDGAPVLTTTISATTPGELFLGNNTAPPSSSGAVQGILDEARIWNVKRTDAEILANYKSVITSATNLTGSWLMNDLGSASTANSVSGAPAFTYTVGQAIPIWTYGRQTATLNATGEINTTNIKGLNLTLGPTTTYNQNIQLKMDGLFLLGNRASNNLAGRAMNIHDTNALINISRYSDGGQPGFELQNWNPTTNALRNTVLFLGGGSGATGDATLRVSGVDSYYTTPTLFSMLIPAQVLVANTFSITGNTPTFRIRNNVAGKIVDYLFNQSAGAYNGLVQAGDNVMVANGGAIDTNVLTICTHNSSSVGIRMTPTAMTMGGNTTFNNNVNILGTLSIPGYGNVKTTLDGFTTSLNALTGITYTSGTDLTTIDNNVKINGTLTLNDSSKVLTGPTGYVLDECEKHTFLYKVNAGTGFPRTIRVTSFDSFNINSNLTMVRYRFYFQLVKLIKDVVYTGAFFMKSGTGGTGTVQLALFEGGIAPLSRLAITDGFSQTGSDNLIYKAFRTAYTSTSTQYAFIGIVATELALGGSVLRGVPANDDTHYNITTCQTGGLTCLTPTFLGSSGSSFDTLGTTFPTGQAMSANDTQFWCGLYTE